MLTAVGARSLGGRMNKTTRKKKKEIPLSKKSTLIVRGYLKWAHLRESNYRYISFLSKTVF